MTVAPLMAALQELHKLALQTLTDNLHATYMQLAVLAEYHIFAVSTCVYMVQVSATGSFPLLDVALLSIFSA